MDLDAYKSSLDARIEGFAGDSPQHQLSVRSHLDLSDRLAADIVGRCVDDLPAQRIDRYLTCDVRMAWCPRDRLELSIMGRNLLNGSHSEFVSSSSGVLPAEVEAGVYSMLTWRF